MSLYLIKDHAMKIYGGVNLPDILSVIMKMAV